MERFARERRVFFFEEFIPTDHHLAYLEFHAFNGSEVIALRPRIPHGWDEATRQSALAGLVDQLLRIHGETHPILWFYTPMMFPIASHVGAAAVVYDCMDELSCFRFAPPELGDRERQLMERADVVFTGGYSIFEAKRHLHDNIHPFPSSVDTAHFAEARKRMPEPPDQADIPAPRLGYYGVIDERIDLDLLKEVAQARPEWSLVMVGPLAKIGEHDLPRANNIHYLGRKAYHELPAYLSGWDVALMPFAMNEATRFISPTKTPEYLAGGRPVVSTPVEDVKRQYGALNSVLIASEPSTFVRCCEKALDLASNKSSWLPEADRLLAATSWDETHIRMDALLSEAVSRNQASRPAERIWRPSVWPSDRRPPFDYMVVGAGFAGSVLAERLAVASKQRVLVCDRRSHIGGNAFDYYDSAGILVHRYGPHIFHTNCDEIVRYLSRFTRWRPYEHRVLANVGGKLLPMPINRTTLNGLYNLDLVDECDAAAFLARCVEPIATILTSRDVVVSQVGSHLYETFFEGYTRKQWGLDPSELDKSVAARVPARTSTDDRYFLDAFQAMPLHGYTRLFENMLDDDQIAIELGIDFCDLRKERLAAHTIFTGAIDSYFDFRFGRLPYRSLEFCHETHDRRRFQPVAVVNYPSQDVPYTRITEYKHLTGQVSPRTSISYEFANADGEPYYPIPRAGNHVLYKKYEALSRQRKDVTFVGRLGTYKYYNMDQVIGQALATHRRMSRRTLSAGAIVKG
jgi:UDP-galactopyranose mutase